MTLPGAAAFTGVPSGAAISTPLWNSLLPSRGSVRSPKLDETIPGLGACAGAERFGAGTRSKDFSTVLENPVESRFAMERATFRGRRFLSETRDQQPPGIGTPDAARKSLPRRAARLRIPGRHQFPRPRRAHS